MAVVERFCGSLAVVGEVLWKFGCGRRGSVENWLL